uniref:Tyrosine-protein kinase ephrin type A/B receptor-like domain-containing protein n=1 Tax=Corethron hystrix TaxID=216773 RepID=A0A7S1FSZ0_9STRA|mmetsp:Transcript_26499/g.61043  ORF Transcript_26499/g.61043 Transcript_26499/m.61043 type:complete len:430 (+) Transcript_26499:309-1598(+)
MMFGRLIGLAVIGNTLEYVFGTEKQCQRDCTSPQYVRPVGPTRPYDNTDPLGNTLLFTRPYPYLYAENEMVSFVFNTTLQLNVPVRYDAWKYGRFERYCVLHTIRKVLSGFSYYRLETLEDRTVTSANDKNTSKMFEVYLFFETEVREEIENQIDNNFQTFFQKNIFDYFQKLSEGGNLTKILHECGSKVNSRSFVNSTLFLSTLPSNATGEIIVHKKTLSPSYPDQYFRACQLGCTLFFSLRENPKQLSSCLSLCDDKYAYNITVSYNDLMELVRLECRDGCHMALMRCQPGYFCLQPSTTLDDDGKHHLSSTSLPNGGSMHECLPGSYRDVSYHAVDTCVPCPPGRFREETRGLSMESCTKCPVGTAVNSTGSSSIRDCKRCPAGRFTTEPGRHVCKCITPQACDKEQLPDPADAEKRNTVPYVGRR